MSWAAPGARGLPRAVPQPIASSRPGTAALLALLVLVAIGVPATAAPPDLRITSPAPGETVRTATPSFLAEAHDPDGDPIAAVQVLVDGSDLALLDPEGLRVLGHAVNHTVSGLLPLAPGNHTLRIVVTDARGEQAERSLAFSVDLRPPVIPSGGPSPRELVLGAAAVLALLAVAAAAAYAFARARHGFTLRRHLLRHPGHVRWLALYIPTGVAVVAGLAALYAVTALADPPRYAHEHVLAGAAVAGVLPLAVDTVRRKRRAAASERAFAQFLFELADAVRGGIDPMRAISQMSLTQEGLLRLPLRRASDALRLGRPLEDALRAMTEGIGSPLVSRYAQLVGEASVMGGGVAAVIQRAARDMEEMVKVRDERNRQMATPTMTMYMSFGVLLLMVVQLVNFAPSLGDIDVGGIGASQAPKVPRIPLEDLQAHMFHLLLLNAAGGGLLVGSFREGKARHGLPHAIAMVAVAALAYPLVT